MKDLDREDGAGGSVLVVVPTYNEHDNLEELFTGIRRHVPEAGILVVDDGSTDGTGELARALAGRLGGIEILQRGRRLGIGSALPRRLHARPRSRLSPPRIDGRRPLARPSLPPSPHRGGEAVDVAIGSRYVHGVSVVNWSLRRLALSVAGNTYARAVTGLPVRDCTSGFQCFRREVLETIGASYLRSNGYAFLVELKFLAHRHGFRFREIPIVFIDRRFGASKNGVGTIFQSMWAVSTLRLRRG